MIRLILTLMIAATTVSAQESKRFITTTPCDPFEKMFETLNKYEEQLLFTGNGVQFSAQDGNPYSGRSFFFVNQDTGTWSHVIIYGDGMACMVANGTDFEPYTGAQPSKDNL